MRQQTEPALFLLGLLGSGGGWPALQPPLLALKAMPLNLCSAPGPQTLAVITPSGEEGGWIDQVGRKQAASVRAGMSLPLRCV